jgi:hypothetical protein
MKNTAREVLSLAGIASPSMTVLKLVVSVDCGFKAGADLCLEPQHRHGLGLPRPRRQARRAARGSAAAAKNLGTAVLAARLAGRITDREAKKRQPAAAKLVTSRALKLALSDAVGWLYCREIYCEAL